MRKPRDLEPPLQETLTWLQTAGKNHRGGHHPKDITTAAGVLVQPPPLKRRVNPQKLHATCKIPGDKPSKHLYRFEYFGDLSFGFRFLGQLFQVLNKTFCSGLEHLQNCRWNFQHVWFVHLAPTQPNWTHVSFFLLYMSVLAKLTYIIKSFWIVFRTCWTSRSWPNNRTWEGVDIILALTRNAADIFPDVAMAPCWFARIRLGTEHQKFRVFPDFGTIKQHSSVCKYWN